jgi:hypothetical protein
VSDCVFVIVILFCVNSSDDDEDEEVEKDNVKEMIEMNAANVYLRNFVFCRFFFVDTTTHTKQTMCVVKQSEL